jgi:galactoside O-acetyltransferase
MSNYYSFEELADMGFAKLGVGVLISRKASIHGAPNISLDDHARIDDFVVMTARRPMSIGKYVHVSCLTFLHGYDEITLGDFVQIGSRVGLYTSTADFAGEIFTNPAIVEELSDKRLFGPLVLNDYVLVGTNSTILPNVVVGEGAAVCAHTLVTESLAPWGMYYGGGAKLIRMRGKEAVLERGRQILAGRE